MSAEGDTDRAISTDRQNMIALRLEYLTRPPAETKLAVIDAMLTDAFPNNTSIIAEKLVAYRWALGGMVLSIVLLASAIISRLAIAKVVS